MYLAAHACVFAIFAASPDDGDKFIYKHTKLYKRPSDYQTAKARVTWLTANPTPRVRLERSKASYSSSDRETGREGQRAGIDL